jgi:hypothetical protein
MGRSKEYPPKKEWLDNAKILLERVNKLLNHLNFYATVSSGYRPGSYNLRASGAALSGHLTCSAIDLVDGQGLIAKAIMNRPEILEEVNLWMENPSFTVTKDGKRWLHLDIKERKNRVFNP